MSLKIEWEKYIKYGWFTSKYGVELPYKFEFDRLENEQRDKEIILSILKGIDLMYDIVAIHTVHPEEVKQISKFLYHPAMIDCGHIPFKSERGYIVYDDVVTTGATISECINILEVKPEFCICLIDRRQEVPLKDIIYTPKITSLYNYLNDDKGIGVSFFLKSIIPIPCPCEYSKDCQIYQRLDPSPTFCLNIEKLKDFLFKDFLTVK